MTRTDKWYVLAYVLYVVLIFSMAYHYGTKREDSFVVSKVPELVSHQPVVKPILKVKKQVVKPAELIVEAVEPIKTVEPDPCPEVEQLQDIIVALETQLSELKVPDEPVCTAPPVCPIPPVVIYDDKEHDLAVNGDAISHNKYIGQKLWERIEREEQCKALGYDI